MANTAELGTENRQLQSPAARFNARLKGRASAQALQAKIIAHEQRALDQALSTLAESDALPKAAALAVAARRRFVMGKGKSFGLAALLAYDLSEGLSNVFLVDDTALRDVDVLSDVRATDVLIVFSFRRYRAQTVQMVAEFKRQGGQVISVTDAADAPLVKFADVAVVVATESASFADSPTAVAAVCHILSGLITASAKGAGRRLQVRDAAFAALGLYAETQPTDTAVHSSVPSSTEGNLS